eukprot:gene7545-9276_t
MGGYHSSPKISFENNDNVTFIVTDCDNIALYEGQNAYLFEDHKIKLTVNYGEHSKVFTTSFVKRAVFKKAVVQFPRDNSTDHFTVTLESTLHGKLKHSFGTVDMNFKDFQPDTPNLMTMNVTTDKDGATDDGKTKPFHIRFIYSMSLGKMVEDGTVRPTRKEKKHRPKSLVFEDAFNDLRDGDVILYSGESKISDLIRDKTNRPWSHVGIIVWTYPPRKHNDAVDSENYDPNPEREPYVMEAVGPGEMKDPFRSNQVLSGVNLFPLKERLIEYGGYAVHSLRLAEPLNESQRERYLRGIWEMHGRRTPFDVLQAGVLLIERLNLWNIESNSSVFCSELVTLALRNANVLRSEEDTPANIDPGEVSDFACFGFGMPRLIKYDLI